MFFRKCLLGVSLLVALGQTSVPVQPPDLAKDVVLFDFENADDLKNWSAFESTTFKAKDPAPALELSTENVTLGSHALKLTFSAGKFAGIGTDQISEGQWKPPFLSFHADVTANRDCLLMLRAAPQDPKPKGADAEMAFVKLARLSPGKNHVEDIIGYGTYASLSKAAPVTRFEIALYDPHEGDVLYIDNIRLSAIASSTPSPYRQRTIFSTGVQPSNYPAYPMPQKLSVLGRADGVKSVVELADQLKDQWVEPKELTIDEVEADFRREFASLKKDHPTTVMALLRDGEKGVDPKNPDKAFDGWQDAYLGAQAPATLSYGILGRGTGQDTTVEFAYRHRCPLYRVDLSTVPAGSKILKAKLVLIRTEPPDRKQLEGPYKLDSPFKPTFWAAEACNRPWIEAETNGYEFAHGKLWKEANGLNWVGDDPDFLPTIVAFGQSGLTVCTWDFTEAVKFWTSGGHENHGFCMYPVQGYLDFGRFWTREQRDVKRRPMMMLIYEPQ